MRRCGVRRRNPPPGSRTHELEVTDSDDRGAASRRAAGGNVEILVVCHANVCRSPMASVMLAHRLTSLGVEATVSSAGLLHAGEPAAALGVEVMATRELDLTEHRSRRLERALVAESDLVLAMARAQLREVVLLAPDVWDRCFTLKELARRGDLIGPRSPQEPLRDWLARASAGRAKSMLLGHDAADDIDDPYGGTRADFERTALELETLVDRVALLAWGRARSN